MAESSQKPAPSKDTEASSQQHPPSKETSDTSEREQSLPSETPETPIQHPSPSQEPSKPDEPETPSRKSLPNRESPGSEELEGLGQSSSPELQLSLERFEEREVVETPVQRRQSTSQVDNTNSSDTNRRSVDPLLRDPTVSSSPYRLIAAQLTEPTVDSLGAGVDLFGAQVARDNERWLGRNRLVGLAGRVRELEEEIVRLRLEIFMMWLEVRGDRERGNRE